MFSSEPAECRTGYIEYLSPTENKEYLSPADNINVMHAKMFFTLIYTQNYTMTIQLRNWQLANCNLNLDIKIK